ncbi:MAG: ferredoxin [Tranquillimonas sp.]
MTLRAVEDALAPHALTILGGLHPDRDELPGPVGTVLLIGPDEPRFWPHIRAQAEFADRAPDPLDRWSRRVLEQAAGLLGARAVFPFGGPPWHPFVDWALRSGHAWHSPATLLVHDRLGLFLSYRGALLIDERLDLPPAGRRPCDDCAAQPCRTACPVGALTPDGYDLGNCHEYLDRAAGAGCMSRGCAVRRACPVGAWRRATAQSAFHMRAFHP